MSTTNWPLYFNMTNTPHNPFLFHPATPLFSPAFLSLVRLLKSAGLKDQASMISRLISLHQENNNILLQQQFPKVEKMDTDPEELVTYGSLLSTMYSPHSLISSPSVVQSDAEEQALDLRCTSKVKTAEMEEKPVNGGNWEKEQINILVEIHLILQQMKATKSKLKCLSKEKKMILREKQRIEQLREQQQRDQPKCSYIQPPKASSASPVTTLLSSIDSVSSTRKPATLWRPIEFSQPPSPPPSLPASSAPMAMVHPPIVRKPKKSSSKSSMTLTPSSMPKQRLPSNQSCINGTKRKRQSAPATSSSSSSSSSSPNTIPDIQQLPCDENDMVTIGPNGTKIPKAALQNINWSLKETYVIRKLLMEVFDRDTLAFHNLSGKPSPAFVGCNKPLKGKLDPLKVADFVHIITKYLNITEKEVRQTITIKCADENKRVRNELMKMFVVGQNAMITGQLKE